MEIHHALQLILPTDKRNPCFSLYAGEDERFIHVFYGLELFEVVPHDHLHMGFKMMVGRLYNAGEKVTTLEDTFNLDRKTIGSWGRAMLSHDPEHIDLTAKNAEITKKAHFFVSWFCHAPTQFNAVQTLRFVGVTAGTGSMPHQPFRRWLRRYCPGNIPTTCRKFMRI